MAAAPPCGEIGTAAMCGATGFLKRAGLNAGDHSTVDTMADLLVHRRPDAVDAWIYETAGKMAFGTPLVDWIRGSLGGVGKRPLAGEIIERQRPVRRRLNPTLFGFTHEQPPEHAVRPRDHHHVSALAPTMGMNAVPQSDHHDNFDLIRIFSALQGLQMHAASVFNLPGRPAWLVFILEQFPGVTIFFIVSGLLITSSYLRGSSVLVAYFARRVLRIYPALLINIVLVLAITALHAAEIDAIVVLQDAADPAGGGLAVGARASILFVD